MAANPQPIDPKTAQDWREAVNLAELYLRIDSARQYGLVQGGPKVNIERCVELINAGRARGVEPDEEIVQNYLRIMTRAGRKEHHG